MKTVTFLTILLFGFLIYANEPLIVAHRGASKEAPENTLPAFKLAWEQGADAIEADFHLTKDGHVVCIHDEDTKRVAKTNLSVSKSTLAELRELDVSMNFEKDFKGTKIPTLLEVFATMPKDKIIYIEIKCGREIIPALLEDIKKSGLKDEQIVIISFKQKVLQELKEKAPQYKVSWLCSLKKEKKGEISPSLTSVLETLESIKADGFSSNDAIPETYIESIAKSGYKWHVWTIDDPKTAKMMKDSGVKSITTNVPKMIKENLAQSSLPAIAKSTWPEGTTDVWNGYTRHQFTIDGCKAWVVEPKKALPGNPWTWCMEFPNAFTANTGVLQLLEKGFHHVHIVVGNTHGSPAALKHFDAFYEVLNKNGLAKKGTLIGISRGGLYAYNWAAGNPDKVACIYGDAPVCDFKSWPGGKGTGKGSKGDWNALIKNYGFKDEAEALAYKKNPIDQLEPLAKAGISLIHVVGDTDDVVPVAENTAIIEERYKALGGTIEVIHKPGINHHPHGLTDPTPVVEFILKHGVVK